MTETMSLVGGLDMYAPFGTRYKSDISPEGRKVKYLNENGWDYDREYANKHFKEGDILTVKEIYVSRSSSKVEFVEFPHKEFNTVMFTDVENENDKYIEFENGSRIEIMDSNNVTRGFTREYNCYFVGEEETK